MKKKIREVLLPKWAAWIFSIVLILIVLFVLYVNETVSQEEKIPPLGIAFLIAIFIVIITIFFLSAYRGLPIYYIREK